MIVEVGDIEGVIEGARGGSPTLHARRSDEPHSARMAFPDKQRSFRFEHLPVGEYVVSVEEGVEQVTSEQVAVVANQTQSLRFTLSSSGVDVTVLVPIDRGRDLRFEPTSEGARVGGRVRGIMRGLGDDQRCSLSFVRPGNIERRSMARSGAR